MPIWPDLEAAGQRYEPSNGTEGDCFHDKWCCNCARDKVMNGTVEQDGPGFDPETDYCQILNASFRSEAVEWIFDANGMPSCTAFTPMDQPIPAPRCEHTPDMFGGLGTKLIQMRAA